MSSTQSTAAPQRPRLRRAQRSSAGVMAQYVQDLTQAARSLRPRQTAEPRGLRVFPARITPIPCS